MSKKKVLIIRFSSIGDIVLTSPIIRSLKKSHPSYRIHFLAKAANKDLLRFNPHIEKLHLLQESLSDIMADLKAEKFDYVLDLHNNLRSAIVKFRLGVPSRSFPKKNLDKFRMVKLKNRELRLAHIVERYGKTLDLVDAELDGEGLELFLPASIEQEAKRLFEEKVQDWGAIPMAVVLGAKHATKRWIPEYFVELLNQQSAPVLLIGGPDSVEEAQSISEKLTIPHWNAVAKFPLLQSAALMKQCSHVLAHDTGFMHIAAAFHMNIYSIWGNTVPEFGMTPYKTKHTLIEEKGLSCRPCSKIGFHVCPKGHFNCMRGIKPERVAQLMDEDK